MTERIPVKNGRGCVAAAKLVDELRQPLAAANNYIGVARILMSVDVSAHPAIDFLAKAEAQILRAGEIARNLRRAPGIDETLH